HLVEDAAGLDHGDVILDRSLAGAHARLRRLLGDRLIRKHSNPKLATALDVAGDRHAPPLDLPWGKRARLPGRQPKLAVAERVAAIRRPRHAAFLHFPVLGSSGLKHLLSFQLRRVAPFNGSPERADPPWQGGPRRGRPKPCNRSFHRSSWPPPPRSRCPREACEAARVLRGTIHRVPSPRLPTAPSRRPGLP